MTGACYLFVYPGHLGVVGPLGEEVYKLLRLVACPDQSHLLSLTALVLSSCVLHRRLHGGSPLRVPSDFTGPRGHVSVAQVVADVWPPALPQPEAATHTSVDEKQTCGLQPILLK